MKDVDFQKLRFGLVFDVEKSTNWQEWVLIINLVRHIIVNERRLSFNITPVRWSCITSLVKCLVSH